MDHKRINQELEALAKLHKANPPGWQALIKWLEREKDTALDYLTDSKDQVEMHRAQGRVQLINSLVSDINASIERLQKQQ